MRSDLLIHWTGRDIDQQHEIGKDTWRLSYVERLETTLENGLWLNGRRPDTITDADVLYHADQRRISFAAPIVCFTELRAHESLDHVSQYGRLGFGFNRISILQRGGNPVLYLRNSDEDLYGLWITQYLKATEDVDPELRNKFEQFLSLVKPMSRKNEDDFCYLDEREWRIIPDVSLVERNVFVHYPGAGNPMFRMPFSARDLEAIVFPDRETLSLSLERKRVVELLQSDKGLPSLVAIEHALEM